MHPKICEIIFGMNSKQSIGPIWDAMGRAWTRFGDRLVRDYSLTADVHARRLTCSADVPSPFWFPRSVPKQNRQDTLQPFLTVYFSTLEVFAPRYYAFAACPLYAGKNTSCTKVSNDVGVVFFSDRGSSGFMYPLLIDADISHSSCAIFLEIPIPVIAWITCSSGN